MKRGFILTLVTVAIALLCGNVFAYAPIIGPIPDVWIGDLEDNIGQTMDINFFRFTSAFNFDQYVSFHPADPNPVTTDVRWSFMTDLTDPDRLDLLLINGKVTVDDPYTEAPEPGAKELTDRTDNSPVPRASAVADFWDIWDSDPGTGPPWSDPVVGSELNAPIKIFASNGAKYTCRDILVKARVELGITELPDKLSGGLFAWENVITFDDPVADGIAKSSETGTDDTLIVPGIYWGTHGTSGSSVAGGPGATHPTAAFYCIFDCPSAAIAYTPGYLYRGKFTLRSNAAIDKVPNTRLMLSCIGPSILSYSGAVRIGRGLFAPGAVARTYTTYCEPPANVGDNGVTSIRPRFEVIAFATEEAGGTNYLDEVVVERCAIPEKSTGNLLQTFSPSAGWSGWQAQTIVPPFGTATVASDGTGLYIETPGPVTAMNYGNWWRPADGSPVSFEADRLYRSVYTLQSSVNTLGQIRGLNQNKATDWMSKFVIQSIGGVAHLPSPTGTEYSNWFDTSPEIHTSDITLNNMSFACDIADGSPAQIGRMYITSVELYYYDAP